MLPLAPWSALIRARFAASSVRASCAASLQSDTGKVFVASNQNSTHSKAAKEAALLLGASYTVLLVGSVVEAAAKTSPTATRMHVTAV